MTQANPNLSRSFNRLLQATTNDEILKHITACAWYQDNLSGDPSSPTVKILAEWMPDVDMDSFLKFQMKTREWGEFPVSEEEPDGWAEQALYRIARCVQLRCLKYDNEGGWKDIGRDAEGNMNRVFSTVGLGWQYADQDAERLGTHAYNSFSFLFIGKRQDTDIKPIHRLWTEARELNPKLKEEIKHPLAPIVRAWIDEQKAKRIDTEYDRKHPVAIIDRASMGSIRNVIVPSTASWTEELGKLKGISAPAPETEQIEIPGLETQSCLPPVLPLQAVHMADGLETTKRGAVAMPIRLFFESIMALEPRETKADIRILLGDLLRYLNPNGKYNRTNHLPYVLKGLHSLYYLRIPYRENPDKPSTEVDWIPVLPRTVPNPQSGNDAPIILEVKLPPDAISGMMVEKEIIRLTGKQSSSKMNAYLAACWIFDKYGTTPQGIIDPTRPIENRNEHGQILNAQDEPILTSRGKPVTNVYHPAVVKQAPREPNPARERYPILSFADLTRACFPKGYPAGEKSKYQKRALKAWEVLERENIVRIEKHDPQGWRIMPSDQHISRYRAIGKSVY